MNDSCIVESRMEEILKQKVKWDIYKCDDLILMQAIFNNNEGTEFPKINTFATVRENVDIEEIFSVFTTLKRK
jgi:hypothetical protein